MRRAAILVILIALTACDSKPKAGGAKTADEILSSPDALTKANEANGRFLASIDLLCKLATDAKASDKPDTEKASMIAEGFMASKPDDELMKLMQSLSAELPENKMKILKAEVVKRGRKNWSCPALDE